MTDTSEATAPIPIVHRGGWTEVVAVFRLRSYRWMFASMLSSSLAGWMSRVAQDWILLELTGNVALVGLTLTIQFLPTLLFGLWGGVLADRFSRLVVARTAHIVTTTCLVAVAVLALADAITVWQIYLVAAVTGLATVFEAPARSALVTQIVPVDRIKTAISLNALTFHGAGLVGPAVSGIVIAAFAAGWSLLAGACLSLVSLIAILCIRRRDLSVVHTAQKGGGVADAVRYSARKPPIMWSLILLFFVATFGMTHTVLYTAAASEVGFDTGAAGYGLYVAMGALGAVIGAALTTNRRSVTLRSVAGAAVCFGLAMLLAAISPDQTVFIVAVVLLSGLRITFGTGAESLVQLSTNPRMRGRVAALYFVILVGGQGGGALLIGWLAQSYGLHVAYAVAGGIPLLAAIVVCVVVARQRGLTLRVDLRRPRRPLRIVPKAPLGPLDDEGRPVPAS
jgi:MFS family permease